MNDITLCPVCLQLVNAGEGKWRVLNTLKGTFHFKVHFGCDEKFEKMSTKEKLKSDKIINKRIHDFECGCRVIKYKKGHFIEPCEHHKVKGESSFIWKGIKGADLIRRKQK